VPQASLDPRSLEFVTAFHNRVQQALDRGREGQVQLIRDMAPRRRADECPIPGDKHFKLPWTGPFTILPVTPSTATLDLPKHWRLLFSTFHFDKLCPFRPRPEAVGPPVPPPPPALLQDGNLGMRSRVWSSIRGGDAANAMGNGRCTIWCGSRATVTRMPKTCGGQQLSSMPKNCAENITLYHQLFNPPPPLFEPCRGEGGRGGGRVA
jgi:hypothetical protein